MRLVGILVSPVCCKTPTQLVQLLSGVWHCSELWHLHHANWCVCISKWTSPCWCAERVCVLSSPAARYAYWRVCVLQRLSDPVCCSLACGYLEVSADVVSACRSGFTILSLLESCIHLADSSSVWGRGSCLPSTVCSPITFPKSIWELEQEYTSAH